MRLPKEEIVKPIYKTVIAGAAAAVGIHFVDESQPPHTQAIYWGTAGVTGLAAYWFRKNPVALGALAGVAVGAAYQGYTRQVVPAQAPKAVPPPSYQYPKYAPPPQYPQAAPAAQPGAFPISPQQAQQLYGAAQKALPGIISAFGAQESPSVPYTQDEFDADTASFDSEEP